MRSTHLQITHVVLAVTVILLVFELPMPANGVQADDSQVEKLLADANDEAFELASDATRTQMLILSDDDWVNHKLMLAKVKGHVDNLALIVEKLTEAQASGSELQNEAIAQMRPLVRELSANTTAAINYLNKNQSRPTSDTYSQYLEKNAEAASQLSSIISSLLDYEKSMTEIERLRSQLKVSSN